MFRMQVMASIESGDINQSLDDLESRILVQSCLTSASTQELVLLGSCAQKTR